MMPASPITVEQCGAFVEIFTLEPTADGPLRGLTFAVKDIIDIAGRKTGCGNPSWRETHPPARSHAVCVEQLLAAGAKCVGKTLTDEVAFSLVGENHFYGTPLNPKAPNRVPGGSSNGSASAVACGLADFALGTDTGGSVRMPANNCGIWGLRPSHDFISVAGVMPFAPTFDTVGVLAKSADVLTRAASVLFGRVPRALPVPGVPPKRTLAEPVAPTSEELGRPRVIHLIREAFALAEPDVQKVHQESIKEIRRQFGFPVRETSLTEIVGASSQLNFDALLEAFCYLQWSEIENSFGGWIAECKPRLGPMTTKNFEMVASFDRRFIPQVIARREALYRALRAFLGPRDLLCIPTSPSPAPIKGSLGLDQRAGNYYRNALSLTSIAGLARLPQVSLPLASVTVEGGAAPIGLSLLGSFGEDLFLLETVRSIATALAT
jgi:amidase